jgi:hypothetical protein
MKIFGNRNLLRFNGLSFFEIFRAPVRYFELIDILRLCPVATSGNAKFKGSTMSKNTKVSAKTVMTQLAVSRIMSPAQKIIRERYGIQVVDAFGDKDGLDAILKHPTNLAIYKNACASFVEEKYKSWDFSKLLKIVELLLQHGAQPNEPHSYPIRGMTPFMFSAENDCLEAFELMLSCGGNTYKEDSLGRNSLQIAREFNSVKVLNYYLFDH